MTAGRHDIALSRRQASELCIFLPLSKYGGRREGRVTAAPGALAPERLREGRVTTGTGGYTPAFPARWFTAYFVLFPVNQRLPPSPAWCIKHRRRLGACVGAPEPHDLTVRKRRRSS